MKRYDPLRAPNPTTWLATDELQRMNMIEDYHLRHNFTAPDIQTHTIIHLTVENQLAENNPPNVRNTLERLMREGVDRHEAVHAISSSL